MHNALSMLHRRVAIIRSYLQAVQNGWALTGETGFMAVDDISLRFFFFFTFIVFTYIYAYLLWKALQGKLSTLPIKGLEIITDSVAFWLRIKTPTMRYGKKKKKDEDE